MNSSLSQGLAALDSWAYPVACWGGFAAAALLSRRLRTALAGAGPAALVWTAVLSAVLSFGFERLQDFAPLWTHLGLPFHEPARTVAQGLSFAAALPTFLCFSFLVDRTRERRGPPPPRAVFALAAILASAAVFLRPGTLDGAMLLGLAAVLVAVDAWNGRSGLPSLIASARPDIVRRALAAAAGGAAWVAVDRLASLVASPGRVYIGFVGEACLWVALALQTLALWACCVRAAAWCGIPLALSRGPDKDPLKIFG